MTGDCRVLKFLRGSVRGRKTFDVFYKILWRSVKEAYVLRSVTC